MDNNHPFWNTVGNFADLIGLNPVPGSRITGALGLFHGATRNLPQGGGSYNTTTTASTPPAQNPALTANNVPTTTGNNEPPASDIAYAVNKIGSAYQGKSAADLWTEREKLRGERSDIMGGLVGNYADQQTQGAPFTLEQDLATRRAATAPLDTKLGEIDKYIELAKSQASGGLGGVGGVGLEAYFDQSPSGHNYIDLSKLTTDEKKALIPLARQAGVPLLDTAESGKLTAIGVAHDNIQNIQNSLKGLLSATPGGNIVHGLENSVASVFGNKNIKSYRAWRTAIINQVQALAGGQGSGLRINQAEIQAALDNDLPIIAGPNADTVGSAQEKLNKLTSQMNTWENRIIGKSAANIANTGIQFGSQGGKLDTSQTTPPGNGDVIEYNGQQYHVDANGDLTPL